MSLGNKKKQPRPEYALPEKETSPRPTRPKRRRLTVWAAIIVGLFLLLGLLPTIITHTPLMAWLVRRAAMLDGTIKYRSASIGWFSSASLAGIEVCDNQGETVLEADGLTCDRTLLKLIFRPSNVGTLRIEKPRLTANFSHEGSNVESLFNRWLTGPTSPAVDLSLEITDGEATIVDQETKRSWHVTGLQLGLDLSRRLAWPVRVEATATVDDRGQSGSLILKAHLKASDTPAADPSACGGLAGTDGDLSLQVAALPLAMIQRIGARGGWGLKLDGKLGTNIEAQWSSTANAKVNGSIQLSIVDQGREICLDKPVTFDLAIRQTDQGAVVDNLTCQSDFLHVEGRGTASQVTAAVSLNLRQLSDDLARFMNLGGLAMSGEGEGKLQWNRSAAGDFEAGGQVEFRKFQLSAPQRQPWSEESLTLSLGAKGHADSSSPARLDQASLQFSAGGDLVCFSLPQPPGELSLRGPLPLTVQAQGRLDRWPLRLAPLVSMQGVKLGGTCQASGQVTLAADSLTINPIKLSVNGLTMSGANWNWSDPAVELNLAGRLDYAASRLQVNRCELLTGLVGARAGGQIQLGNPGDVQLTGDMTYQWEKINSLLQPYCGTAIQFSGAATSPMSYRGLLSGGQADASVQFAAASVYGLQLGPGELKAHLANRVLSAEPLEVVCSQGRIVLQPELRMDRQPMQFRISAGTLARHVQLDESACRSALKYAVPVLASVTQSKGQFSIELDGCSIPIGDLNRAEIAGRVIVHSAEMVPGPVLQHLATTLAANPKLVTIPAGSVIQFRMTGGRIYHQGLTLECPELTVRTYGSVGLDESLKLMIETSVPLAWLPNNTVTDAVKKQKMQIPMGGTLKSPQLDVVELARVKNQVLGNLARGVLQTELGNSLNRVLQPQR